MKGKMITRPERIMELARMKKAVFVTTFRSQTSASFITGMPLRAVMNLINGRNIYEYKKENDHGKRCSVEP